MKLLTLLLISGLSLTANADLVINRTIKDSGVFHTEEIQTDRFEFDYESMESLEDIIAQAKTIYTTTNTYKLAVTPSQFAKTYSLKITKDGKNISHSYYLAKQSEIQHEIKLTDGQGKYDIIYTEFDFNPALKNKIFIQKYALIYKNPDIVKNAKTSKWVQSKDPKIVELATSITSAANSDKEKVLLINEWVTQNISYNYTQNAFNQKIDAITTLELGTAICTGYANLFAALARASGLETKVMTGKAKNGDGRTYYHQWNEVKINGIWYFIDTTWNAGMSKNKLTFFSKVINYPKSHYKGKEVRAY